MQTATSRQQPDPQVYGQVAILLALSDIAARLTLEAVLRKSGYSVDSAASSAEAMQKIEDGSYALILCDLEDESAGASRRVIKLAHNQEYRPATAYLCTSGDHHPAIAGDVEELYIATMDVADLLTDIANLIGNRAVDRSRRTSRRARRV
jgi:CheY-like chemotaxis protein